MLIVCFLQLLDINGFKCSIYGTQTEIVVMDTTYLNFRKELDFNDSTPGSVKNRLGQKSMEAGEFKLLELAETIIINGIR